MTPRNGERNFKAGSRVDERNPRQICVLITRLKTKWSVTELCRLLRITRSVYYASRHQHVDVKRLQQRTQARELHQLSRGSAGSRTLNLRMRRKGHAVGRWLARKLMQECGLLSRQPGKHQYRGSRETSLASPNQAWCGDISYIRIHGGWCYLALVIELYSRRIVGFALSLSPDADRVCRAMRNALETRRRHGRLIFHSDQGSQ